jgi:hypothetical protein
VIEGGGGADLVEQRLRGAAVLADELDRDLVAAGAVDRGPHLAHAASPEEVGELEAADLLAGHGRVKRSR